jgi:CheY-like chemotaxis protein
MGIAPDKLPVIFDAFVQAPQALARTTGGLGLGLTIVKNLVELHGGRVVARSEGVGKGTEIEVRLPLAPAGEAVAEVVSVARGTLPPLVRRRVLIVDDNQDAAVLIAELLHGEGHDIRTAFDATTALAIAREFRPDIAVLDLGLPLIDGYELARRLREDPTLGRMRLIALTGYSQASDRARSLDAGFDRHLAKPVPIDMLLQLVADL